jgi:hypothetical protein
MSWATKTYTSAVVVHRLGPETMSVAGLIATELLPAGRAPNPVQLVWTK